VPESPKALTVTHRKFLIFHKNKQLVALIYSWGMSIYTRFFYGFLKGNQKNNQLVI
jgi:hypothetical protein